MPELWFLAMLLAATDPLPPDVKVFVERRSHCEHWAGEEPYDAPRAAEIEAALRQFHCDSVEAGQPFMVRPKPKTLPDEKIRELL